LERGNGNEEKQSDQWSVEVSIRKQGNTIPLTPEEWYDYRNRK